MHYKYKYDCFEYCLAGVAEYKCHNHNLGADVEKKLARGNIQNHETNDQYDDANYNVHNLVELVNGCFCIVECQGESSSFNEGIDLQKSGISMTLINRLH